MAAACLAALIVVGRGLEGRHAALRLPSIKGPHSLGFLAAEWFGLRKVMADKRWFDTLQYAADYGYMADDCSRLYSLADAGTDFDPHFIDFYSFGGAMLMWNCRQPETAARVLRKGIEFNPDFQRFKLYLAAFAYRQDRELAAETKILEQLAFSPGAPPMLRRILANLYIKTGRDAHAAAICHLILKISLDVGERRWAASLLQRLGRAPREK